MCCIKSLTERRWLIILSRLAGGPGGRDPVAGLWPHVGGVAPFELVVELLLVDVVWLLLDAVVEVLVPVDAVVEGPDMK